MTTRPIRVPNIPPKPLSPLHEVQQILNPTTPEAKKAKAEFIRDELARIGNEIDAKQRRKKW